MKKIILALLSFMFLLSGCNKSSSSNNSSSTTSEISNIRGETIYYPNGKEATFNGDVILLTWNGNMIELGTVVKGKLTITLPDFEKSGLSSSNRVENIQELFNNWDLKITVVPKDAEWYPLSNPFDPIYDSSKNARIVVLSDEQESDVWNPNETKNINYVLNLSGNSETNNLTFVFFTKDTTIKGKGKRSFFGVSYDYDIDIKIKRGWNKLYVQETESSVSLTSTPKNKEGFRWTTLRTELFWL
jgi:hypothetical protein